MGVVPDERRFLAHLRGDGAHGDNGLVTVDAGLACGQGVDIPGHDILNDGVQILAHAQIIGEVVQGIVDHRLTLLSGAR